MSKQTKLILMIILACGLLFTSTALGSTLGSYKLSWWTVDGGGAHLIAGSYSLAGTTGQPDAGLLSASSYTLSSGFWTDGSYHRVYLPVLHTSP